MKTAFLISSVILIGVLYYLLQKNIGGRQAASRMKTAPKQTIPEKSPYWSVEERKKFLTGVWNRYTARHNKYHENS